MKITKTNVINAITALDPASTSFVTSLTLYLEGGREFVTNDVTVNGAMLSARRAPREFVTNDVTVKSADIPTKPKANVSDVWLYIPIEQVVGFTAQLDSTLCASKKLGTLDEVIGYHESR